ncbi:hypothetical protein [Nocardia sp. CA-119907]|uniref:hypothetical protein n=1 Tax=Nocardia sp. CA-119907 TaxID=3239973 RepID=UPI003D96A423
MTGRVDLRPDLQIATTIDKLLTDDNTLTAITTRRTEPKGALGAGRSELERVGST